jgi:hypothetical protein
MAKITIDMDALVRAIDCNTDASEKDARAIINAVLYAAAAMTPAPAEQAAPKAEPKVAPMCLNNARCCAIGNCAEAHMRPEQAVPDPLATDPYWTPDHAKGTGGIMGLFATPSTDNARATGEAEEWRARGRSVEAELPCINGLSAWVEVARCGDGDPFDEMFGGIDREANARLIASAVNAFRKVGGEIDRLQTEAYAEGRNDQAIATGAESTPPTGVDLRRLQAMAREEIGILCDPEDVCRWLEQAFMKLAAAKAREQARD